MEGSARDGSLDQVIDLIPDELEDKKVRQRLRKLTRSLDELTAEDSGETIVDRSTLRRLVRDDDIFPQEVQDRVQRELEGHLRGKLKDKGGNARTLKWRELADRDTPIVPTPISELRRLGIDSSTSVVDAKRILVENFDDIPKQILDADGPQLRKYALDGLGHNRSVWDCVVAKLGFWAALGIFAAVGAFLIVGTATGPWGLPLAIWLIAVLGFGSGTIVGNCVLNPDA
jgi:hypothetical protein